MKPTMTFKTNAYITDNKNVRVKKLKCHYIPTHLLQATKITQSTIYFFKTDELKILAFACILALLEKTLP